MLDKLDVRDLRERDRATAELRNGVIVAIVAGGKYDVRMDDTGGIIRTESLITATLAVGKGVVVRFDSSGRASNKALGIVGLSTFGENGAPGRRLMTEATSVSAGTISALPPLPVVLKKGGSQEKRTIFGSGFTAAATYGNAEIVNDVAQVVSSSMIVISPRATSSCALGRYSLTVAGKTISNFFEVIA